MSATEEKATAKATQTAQMPRDEAQTVSEDNNTALIEQGAQTALVADKATESIMPRNVWSDKVAFNQTLKMAQMLSQSALVPQNYQNKPQDCFIAIDIASRLGCSPIYVMQNLYVVKGKPSWAGQACMAIIMASNRFANVRLCYVGKPGSDDRGCYVKATRLCDGEEVTGTVVTMEMAKAEGWTSNSKWRNMGEQMLGYRAASFFARLHCPDALMGLQTDDEIVDVDSAKRSNLTDILK